MTRVIKTNISSSRNIIDINGHWLPPGNYKFLVKRVNDRSCLGAISWDRCDHYGQDYEFRTRHLVRMMAVAQGRLARLAGISDFGTPSYADPIPSPPSSERSVRFPAIRSRSEPKCAICLDSLQERTQKMIHCGHSFHRSCIDTWFRAHTTCPLCRRVRPVRIIGEVTRRLGPSSREILNGSVRTRQMEHDRFFASAPNLIT